MDKEFNDFSLVKGRGSVELFLPVGYVMSDEAKSAVNSELSSH